MMGREDMEPIGNPLDMIVEKAQSLNPVEAGDYIGADGLLYCGKCHTPRQTRLFLEFMEPPQERVFPVQCQCRVDADTREKELVKKTRDIERLSKLKNQSLMDVKFEESTFQSFVTTKYNERALKLCRRYAEGFDEMLKKTQGLLLWGGYGTGKSFIAACIANYLLGKMVPVVMTSFVKILESVQGFRNDDEERQLMSLMNRADLLIIDDLGTERNTDFALEKVYNVVDGRYRARKPLILTTNLTLEQLKVATDLRYARIYDRIFEMCYPIEFKGPSWRKQDAVNRFEEITKFLEGD